MGARAAWGGLPGHRHRSLALSFFFGSVLCNAALGIAGLAGGGFGATEGRLFGTSLSATAALLLALLCLPAWERGLLGAVPAASAAGAAGGFAVVVAGIWSDGGPTLGRVVATLLVPAGAGVLASLVALARVSSRHQVVVRVAYGLAAIVAVAALVQIWAEAPTDLLARAIGILGILLAALVVSIPVIHRIDRPAAHANSAAAHTSSAAAHTAATRPDAARVGFCPRCGAPVVGTSGESITCPSCSARFVVRDA